ncbi:MAG: hypothetical protein JJT75_07010 [Opitutales bacterium]|nr:hypothetical protein [Opitutales bacterium]MCH8539426.1 hypothetical protein [Opitutales bacterium]
MISFDINSPNTYRRTLRIHANDPAEAFANLSLRLINRFLQNTAQESIPERETRAMLREVWAVAAQEGFPEPLPSKESGEPGEMSTEDRRAWADKILAKEEWQAYRERLLPPFQQLFAALLLPEFKKCRLSYKEKDESGSCQRQDPEHNRNRICGSHCADCPYWVELSPEQNEKLLRKSWPPENLSDFIDQQDLFLPEDFRVLRHFLYMNRRFG